MARLSGRVAGVTYGTCGWSPAPAGTATVKTVVHPHATVLRAHFVTDALGANEVQGAKLRFRVTDNGKDIYRNRMGAGQRSAAKFRFAQGTGKHVVQVLKNGVVDSRTVIKTGR